MAATLLPASATQARGEGTRKASVDLFPPPCGEAVVVVLGIESGVDVEPRAHAPMIEPRRLAVGRHRAGVADAVFVYVGSYPRHLLSLARRQRESHLGTPGLHRKLAYVSRRRRAQKGHRLSGVRRARQTNRCRDAKRRR